MFHQSKAVVFTVIAIIVCGPLFLWIIRDPSVSIHSLYEMTVGAIFLVMYLLYRSFSCTQCLSFENGHVYMGKRDNNLWAEKEYKLAYRSTFLVFSGFNLLMRDWRPETGTIVFSRKDRYIPFSSLFDRIFPASNARKQVLFFGAWKRPSGVVVPDGELQRQIELICSQQNIVIKTVWLELELFGIIMFILLIVGGYYVLAGRMTF